jgi:DNA-binding response OmpR family regulator
MYTKKTSVLVVDDDPRILRLLSRNLEMAGYQALSARDGWRALEQIEAKEPGLVLLDITMNGLNGFEVCRRVREFSTLPIIILTAREQEQDKIRGLDLGADDYLTKPFGVGELLARVQAVLRRGQWDAVKSTEHESRPKMNVGDLTIDFVQREVTVHDRIVELTPTEYLILKYLAQNIGHIVTPDLLLENVWGEDYASEYHLLIVNINRVRRKVEPDPTHPTYIITRKGIGYLMPSHLEPARKVSSNP